MNYNYNYRNKHYYNRKNMICQNCGKKGHHFKICKNPKNSFGIIAFKRQNNINKYLLICRRNTIGFVQFLRGKYILSDISYIQKLFDVMTNNEIELIQTNDFKYLWEYLWLDKFYSTQSDTRKDYNSAQNKFIQISKGKLIDKINYNILYFINNKSKFYEEPEWGFPKGRRNHQERDIVCGTREFCEETGVKKEKIKIIENIIPYEETFMGSNYKSYKHKYYIAYMDNCNDSKTPNTYQKSEVSKMEWKNINEAYTCIRPYNLEKKDMLEKIDNMLNNYNFKNLNNLN